LVVQLFGMAPVHSQELLMQKQPQPHSPS